jgi:hypothetical protein
VIKRAWPTTWQPSFVKCLTKVEASSHPLCSRESFPLFSHLSQATGGRFENCPENRDLRQLLWHRHRLVQMRARIMNQLHALAMNEGYRWKKKLFSEQGRAQLEKLALGPWASPRRQELLELLNHGRSFDRRDVWVELNLPDRLRTRRGRRCGG